MRKWTCGSTPRGNRMRSVASNVSTALSGWLAMAAMQPSLTPRCACAGPAGRTTVPPLIARSNAASRVMLTGPSADGHDVVAAAEDLPEVDGSPAIVVEAEHRPAQALRETQRYQLERHCTHDRRQELVVASMNRQHHIGQRGRF